MVNKTCLKYFFLIIICLKLITLYLIFWDEPTLKLVTKTTGLEYYFGSLNPPNEEFVKQEIQASLPYIPFDFLERFKHPERLRKNDSCAYYPNLVELQMDNTYWQVFDNKNVKFKLYGAYYDKRKILDTPAIRITGMSRETNVTNVPKSYCQVWFDKQYEPIIVPVSHHRVLWNWGMNINIPYSHMLTCSLPENLNGSVPQTVSLVANECDTATNNFKVIFQDLEPGEEKQEFALCHKGLDFPYVDMSARLVEWLEMQKLLGVKKVAIYRFSVHENVLRVLDYYEDTGFVEVMPITLSDGFPNEGAFSNLRMKYSKIDQMMHEMIPYNDCFYKNMYKFKHIALMDADEVIVPQGNVTNWHDLFLKLEEMREPQCEDYASYCFRNAYFPKYENEERYSQEVPPYMHMLQHVKRIEKVLGYGIATKCIHNTEYDWAMHNHFPFEFSKACFPRTIEPEIALMHHYRQPDNGLVINDTTVNDKTIWRYKDKLVGRCNEVFQTIFETNAEEIPLNDIDENITYYYILIFLLILALVPAIYYLLVHCLSQHDNSKPSVSENVKYEPLLS